jgi:hypothetical protein
MATKQFYFICLIGITFFCGIVLLLIKKKLTERNDNKSLFFIALGMFSWSTIAFYKLFDPPVPFLLLSDIDRIFSVFTNIFFVIALPFFPAAFIKFRQKVGFFRKTEQWVSNAFVFFAFLAALFAVIERNIESDYGKNLIIVIDSVFSTITIGLISYAVYKSFTMTMNDTLTKVLVALFMCLFPVSQVLIPATAIFPDINYLYIPLLICLLLGLVFFSFITIANYTLLIERKPELPSNIEEVEVKQADLQINSFKIGYDTLKKLYFIEMNFLMNGTSVAERVENRKILLPFSNWILFSIAKKLDVKILNHDIALTKFRMVEYWNKESEIKINQDYLFTNNHGFFEFNLDDKNIELIDFNHLENKFIIKEAIQKHIENFSSLFPTKEKAKLNSSEVLKLFIQSEFPINY